LEVQISWGKYSFLGVSMPINKLTDLRSSAVKKIYGYYFSRLTIWKKIALEGSGGGIFSKRLMVGAPGSLRWLSLCFLAQVMNPGSWD